MSHSASQQSPLWLGVPLSLASTVLFGASTPFAKLLLSSIDPQVLAGLLYLGAGVGLAVSWTGRKVLGAGTSEAPLRLTDIPWLVAVVAFGSVAGPMLLMLGLARTSAASGSLLLNLEGLATMTIAWVVFRRTWTDGSCLAQRRFLPAESFCPGTDKGSALTQAAYSLSQPVWLGASTTI